MKIPPHLVLPARLAPLPALARPTVAEAFAGCGGLSQGLHDAGFRGVWAGEMFDHAANSYAANFPEVPLFRGKIETGDELGEARPDVIAGGFPCQPFSQAGMGLGADDPRDGFPVFIRMVARARPRAFLGENVKGLTTATHRPYLDAMVGRLRALGYTVDWRVLNAADYGTPQKRQRLILAGFRDAADAARWTWPTPTHSLDALVWAKWVDGSYWREHGLGGPPASATVTKEEARALDRLESSTPPTKRWRTVRDAIGDIVHLAGPGPTRHSPPVELAQPTPEDRRRSKSVRALRPDVPGDAVQAAHDAHGGHAPCVLLDIGHDGERKGGTRAKSVLYKPTLPDLPVQTLQAAAEQQGSEHAMRIALANHDPEPVSPLVQRRIEAGEVDVILRKHPPRQLDSASVTVESNLHRGGYYGLVATPTLRRLTVRECARLQGFPDSFILTGPKTACYRQIGNAVPRELALAVGHALKKALGFS